MDVDVDVNAKVDWSHSQRLPFEIRRTFASGV